MFHKLRDETKSDPELQQLQKVVMSGWPQTRVARLSSKVILAMKDMFPRHGIPERLIADSKWEFEVVTSSQHYPKSNGLVERNVKTVKHLIRKADESRQDAFLTLLEFRNSPISGMDESPAELLMTANFQEPPTTAA